MVINNVQMALIYVRGQNVLRLAQNGRPNPYNINTRNAQAFIVMCILGHYHHMTGLKGRVLATMSNEGVRKG